MGIVVGLIALAVLAVVVAYVVKHPKPNNESVDAYAEDVVDGTVANVKKGVDTAITDLQNTKLP